MKVFCFKVVSAWECLVHTFLLYFWLSSPSTQLLTWLKCNYPFEPNGYHFAISPCNTKLWISIDVTKILDMASKLNCIDIKSCLCKGIHVTVRIVNCWLMRRVFLLSVGFTELHVCFGCFCNAPVNVILQWNVLLYVIFLL